MAISCGRTGSFLVNMDYIQSISYRGLQMACL